MKAKFLMTAAALALVAGGANAQQSDDTATAYVGNGPDGGVVANLANLADEYGGVFVNVATNFSDIDGSIDITGEGEAGGSLAGEFNFDSGIDVSNIDIIGGATDGAVGGATVDVNVFGEDVCDATGDSVQCDVAGDISEFANASGAFNATLNSTDLNFGDLSTLAAGAVNDTTTDLTEEAGSIVASSGGFTTATESNASFEALSGAGTIVLSGATNFASIDGGVQVITGGGNMDGGAISTTAAGAISTADITATFFGEAETTPLIP